ncbi:hypothetical protein DSO57_1027176 [Entomophthora muscae]|uniref:Uncharacterized protein n=1 Tax=Entomophthora muscae TaxID=34485 RepID=A0ACC2SEG2_9FUNG|nr:hypothetical protein DSO57_1027176 [Entomophthora muscae]
MSGNNIRVLCRFRPQNKREIESGGEPIISYSDDKTTIKINSQEYPGEYTFDSIYDHTTSQKAFFESSIKATVDDVINGYNGTVFAYGQTGSGKTFTMMGAGGLGNEDLKGITPRIVETIFDSIYASTENIEYLVKVSYMEIYMERIKDLLNPVQDNLPIHEDKVNGVYVKGVTEVYVASVDEVYEVLNRGSSNRVVAFTKMNAESSRSHSLFIINVEQKNLTDGSQKRGRMFLVDLAGSEKVGKTGASGQTLEEAKKINKSLSALGMVINALTDGKSKHVPYRDSKLTRLLQEALGGNSRTTLIINCSPSSYNDAETVSTLRFGMRAKSIKNKAKVNAELSPAELKAMLKKTKAQMVSFQQYISALEGEVKVWRSGGTVPKESYAAMGKGGATTSPSQTPAQPPSPGPAPALAPPKAIPDHLLDNLSRPSTPGTLVEDEREEFMRRENDLTSLLTEKESELANQTKLATDFKVEIESIKKEFTQASEENSRMSSQLDQLRSELEKITFDRNEAQIHLDSITEANEEMSAQLKELKSQLQELVDEKAAEIAEKNKLIKTVEMMSKMEPSLNMENWSAKEQELRNTMASLDSIEGKEAISDSEARVLRDELARSKQQIEEDAQVIIDYQRNNVYLTKKCEEIEARLTSVELEYEEMLEKTIADEEETAAMSHEAIVELKAKIEAQYNSKKEIHLQEITELREQLESKSSELKTMKSTLSELKHVNEELKIAMSKADSNRPKAEGADREKDIESIRKTMAKQLSDFDIMKKSLMRDLQNKCEKVIELEITLEATRDQLNASLKSNNTKNQQQKLLFLERNLEQLTNVQKQLVEQNTNLKKEVHLAERKLTTRNERITSLEALLKDNQEKLSSQTAKFEKQLNTLRERLDSVMVSKQQASTPSPFSFGRIARPLRGTAPAPDDANSLKSEFDNLTGASRVERTTSTNKRASWLWGK